MEYEIKLPMDNDGFTELQCPYCSIKFKVRNEEFIDIDHNNLYCPICGLTGEINTFYTKDVYDKAIEIAKKEMFDIINKTLFKGIKSTQSFKVTKNDIDVNENKTLIDSNYSMIITKLKCCNVHIKVREIDKFIGVYCPYCGGDFNE